LKDPEPDCDPEMREIVQIILSLFEIVRISGAQFVVRSDSD